MTDRNEVPGVGEVALRAMYLDLLKRALTHTLYWPPDFSTDMPEIPGMEEALTEAFEQETIDIREVRAEGRDWPLYAQTMVGLHRLNNLHTAVETVIVEEVPGDLIEAGVWRGGASILMRGVLAAYGVDDRLVFVADSFRGLPRPNPEAYPADEGDVHFTYDALAVPRKNVERNFEMYDLLDDNVKFLEGWFSETLPSVKDRTWAIVRVDGDMYESTMDTLVNLYPGLSIGGYCIIDDFWSEPCRRAVDDFRSANGIDETIETIDWTGVFWRRQR